MRKRSPTKAEQALWRGVTRDVRRLVPDAAPDAPPLLEVMPALETLALPLLPAPEPLPAKKSAPGPVDRATEERLRRGRVAVEGRIDLHGMTQAEAFPALLGFLAHSAQAGRRAILVITGKGPAGKGGGVLRRNAPGWLKASPLASRILTIVPAHARHGGDGAFYVMLRRDKTKVARDKGSE